ncbi:TPA: hypothetical protein N0F65_005378 [Lagenidium giganteum]|uniref:Mitochondrial carrier protein n=1 Tax=Lagenidium giganteum TaxID=4803 RepID=A0AAV2Z129_9STRA|nr:TPA: hypothetical protein N0F65_005378 [Lagenidium giganteum]
MIGRIFCHPIDTIKARLQASTSTRHSIASMFHAFPFRPSQLRSLYRGLGVSMIGSAPATCLYLTSYEVSKDSLHGIDAFRASPSLLYLGSGMLAEALSCVLWVPIDVIKERMQVQTKASGSTIYYRNTAHAVQTIMQTERLQGLYKGYGATLLSFGPFSALYFMFYEQNKAWAQNMMATTVLAPQYTLACAATAGAAASFLTNPLDLIKLRLQVQRAGAADTTSAAMYTGVVDGLTKVIRTEGVLALFKGAGARVAFHAPSTAITMSLFESCRQFYAELLAD